jgi:hypothetical protein
MQVLEGFAWEGKIYIGRRRRYDGPYFNDKDVTDIISEFQGVSPDEACCVRLTNVQYVFNGYTEYGFEIASLNYIRFPKTVEQLESFIIKLGKHLLVELDQNRITVTLPGRTLLLVNDSAEESPGNSVTDTLLAETVKADPPGNGNRKYPIQSDA